MLSTGPSHGKDMANGQSGEGQKTGHLEILKAAAGHSRFTSACATIIHMLRAISKSQQLHGIEEIQVSLES